MAKPFDGVGYAASAYAIMQGVYDAAIADGKDDHTIVLEIQAAYPWEQRRGWRYRAWLRARQEFFQKHNLPGLRWFPSIEEQADEANLLPGRWPTKSQHY